MLILIINIISLTAGLIALITAIRNYRMMRKHYRRMDVRMMFISLWGSSKCEFIKTENGWHAFGHRPMGSFGPETDDDHEVVVVPWPGK